MRLSISIAYLSVLILGGPCRAQEARDPDGAESILKALAEGYKDRRSIAQIKKDNALIRAAAKGDVQGVRKALKDGALINSRYLDGYAFLDDGESGCTALMRASLAGHHDVVKLLIEEKADVNLESLNLGDRGRTSLDMAVIAEKETVVKLLVKAGAKGDPKQIQLSYDLHRAACRGFKISDGEGYPLYPGSVGDPEKAPQITDVLKRGANVNSADPQGYTALMYAANLGSVENVQTLLAKGADATLKSKDGETALSLAERPYSSVARAERRQVVEILKAHLAKKK